jgi:Protein of unknown function (DUF3761)
MRFATPFVIAAGLVVAFGAFAKSAPADAPAGSTALCKDGSYFSGAEKKGACSGHQGIKDWYGIAKTDAKAEAGTDAAAAAKAKADAKAQAKAEAKAKADAKTQAKADAKAKADAAKADLKAKTDTAKTEVKDKAAALKPATPAAPAAAATAAAAPVAAAATRKVSTAPDPDTLTAAAGGGAGLVWVNESTKVYHCQGDRWYGKTKQGAYLPEAQAKAKGYKGDHGKACGQ